MMQANTAPHETQSTCARTGDSCKKKGFEIKLKAQLRAAEQERKQRGNLPRKWVFHLQVKGLKLCL